MRAADEKLIINELGPNSHEYTCLFIFCCDAVSICKNYKPKRAGKTVGSILLVQFAYTLYKDEGKKLSSQRESGAVYTLVFGC